MLDTRVNFLYVPTASDVRFGNGAITPITGEGRLLDLACGPGRVALALVSSFREVWALDREPEMIAVGQHEATQRGANNITWRVGKAEDVAAPPAAGD